MRDLFEQIASLGGEWIAYAAIVLIAAGGAAALVLLALIPDSPARRQLERYQAALDREIEFLLLRTSGERIAHVQIGIAAAVLVAAFLVQDVMFLVLVPLVLFTPLAVLRSRREKRIIALEQQIDGWLVILSNALKAAPSLGEALATSGNLSRAPISEEIDLVLKEVRLGSPIDRALLHMTARVNSRPLWGAVATLLVARQTGGDVSRILEESAEALREMARLEGVVRSKTADGRNQAYVLAGMPFVLLAAIHMIDPGWLEPLGESFLGFLVVGGASALWVLGFLSARKILAVDL